MVNMLIYFCLIIPIAAVIILAWKFSAKMAWWEYLLVFGIPLIAIVIAKYTSVATQVMTKEIWNTYLTKATYYEPWNEYIHQACYQTCTDKDGNTYSCNPYDCSYVQYHPAYWEAMDNTGRKTSITSKFYSELCVTWNNKYFEEMHRSYHTIDGNAYNTVKDTSFDHIIPRTTVHMYENRVKCSRSVFNFSEVDSEDVRSYGLYKYPPEPEFGYNPILGFYNPKASARLQKYNGLLGSMKQVHMMVLVFKDQPVQAALLQESYWKGGNKNEFILCIGIKDTAIQWAKVISWTEVDELKIRVEKEVQNMPLDMIKIADYMAGQVRAQFQRKHFRDFSYISVEPTMTAVWVTLIITILITVGVTIFALKNDFDQNGKSGFNGHIYRR
jgi:hypothetical protein